MEDDAPMNLCNEQFEEIEDSPIDDNDNESFYNADGDVELEEEEVHETPKNFKNGGRFKTNMTNPKVNDLTTIEEKNEDLRSAASSRSASRPASVMSDKSFSSQFEFQSGGENAIEEYTNQVFADENKADLLFPETSKFMNGASPPKDKHHSWEPSIHHYDKQPPPDIQTNSPVFGNLNHRKNKLIPQARAKPGANDNEIVERDNDENVPTTSDKSAFITSPMNSTNHDEKTSTPKRPTNRKIGQYQGPNFDLSSIYVGSPQHQNTSISTGQQMPTSSYSHAHSETMMTNQTINESMVRRVLNGNNKNQDLFAALEEARKRRAAQPSKPDFRINTTRTRVPIKPTSARHSGNVVSSTSNDNTTAASSKDLTTSRKAMETFRQNASMADATNSNTASMTSILSTISTARTDISRSSRNHGGGFSNTSVSTVIPANNGNVSLSHGRDGRDSVSSVRTMSRASSTSTVYAGSTFSGVSKPLRIHAKRVAFGCVAVGETLRVEVEVENISDRQCLVRASTDSTTPVYQILDNKLTMVDPKKSIKFQVSFSPSSVGRYQVIMSIEVPAQNFIHKIPMWGNGGIAKFVPTSPDLQQTINQSEYAMCTSCAKRISFKISNSAGTRDGFAMIKVFDSAMRQLPDGCVAFFPAPGFIVKKKSDKRVDIRIDSSYIDLHDENNFRTSSSLSTASTTSSFQRRILPGAKFFVHVVWGEETMRTRLRLLEVRTGQHQLIDGHDFTSFQFSDEEVLRAVPVGFPAIKPEDRDLFAASYRSFFINFFTSTTEFRAATSRKKKEICSNDDSTLLETTAFRNQTFVNDVTIVPNTRFSNRK